MVRLDDEFSGEMRAVQSAENFQNKMAMEGVPGSLGTSVGFSLRIGQTLFSSAALLFMSLGVEFYSYTAFSYVI